VWTIDFETEAIGSRPDEYPPKAVGVALKQTGRSPEYLAWGHPEENNCSYNQARKKLKTIWTNGEPKLFHHGAFDIEVGYRSMQMPALTDEWHDTLILGYLHDPRDTHLSLKPMADKYLDMPPEEQEELRDWILENIPEARRKPSSWGAYIAKAPGRLVGRYAIGDVVRTEKLFHYFMPIIAEEGMSRAYRRERDIIPIKLKMEQQGMPVAPKLKRDIGKFRQAHEAVESRIQRKLRTGSNPINIGSGPQLADALVKAKKLRHIVRTKTGRVSTKRAVLEENCKDKELTELLGLHSVLGNYLSTFLERWVEAPGGILYPSYNTTRSSNEYGGRGGVGTRTGRFSSSNPNFQNVPTSIEESQHRDLLLKLAALLKEYGLVFYGLRDYIVPPEGWVFIGRDYSQQELRILAHYEDGELLQAYLSDPKLDVHTMVQQLVHQATGILYPRKFIKVTNFGMIYGMGAGKLANQLDISYDEATSLKRNVMTALPGVKWLNKELKNLARKKEPLYTWGGRRYFCEDDKWFFDDDGRQVRRRLDYKMLNLLIQGSAADNTKEAMINVDAALDPRYAMQLVQVHDELLGMARKGHEKKQMRLMTEAMEDVHFDVPMLTDGKMGALSWARMKEAA